MDKKTTNTECANIENKLIRAVYEAPLIKIIDVQTQTQSMSGVGGDGHFAGENLS